MKMTSSVVYIARHGERIDHVDKSWKQQADSPHDPFLTEVGLRQANSLGQHLSDKRLSHIFCSPFLRTVQTANEVSKVTGLPIKIEPGLSEWLHREWFSRSPKLLPIDTLKAKFPSIDTTHTPVVFPDYPETRDRVIARSAQTATLLASKYTGNILLVAHGMTCEFTARGLTRSGPVPYIAYCSLQTCVLADDGQTYHVHGPNEPDVSFIPEEIRPYVKTGVYQ
ncbi:Protein UBASH3A-like [Gracilariopsis chorda]|uniref:Protein UBASH3A-like n=1 Tax=Gracilariopsis chorda TaxID=448386 RepID=A0A2V3IVC3_9FLOR|nr:Protein UBASH3A-like [Gracilariopsis chorda]|eukprot:PXF46033.1 Protein UBASH3A-like [Gracilariopsis chorda]